jgi:hypothetical protein
MPCIVATTQGKDDMVKSVVKAASVPTALWIIAIMGGCSTDGRKIIEERGSSPPEMLRGVFHSGEYAYFESSDGRAFDLRLLNVIDQRRLAPFIPLSFDGESMCAALHISGRVAGNADQPGRRVFLVSQIHRARRTPCPA